MVAAEVEGDVEEAERFECFSKRGVLVDCFLELIRMKFESRNGIVVSDTMSNEAESFENEFRFFDLAKFVGSDFGAVWDARGEAGVGGFVPVGET